MAKMLKKYSNMLNNGTYDNIIELCNNEQLNIDELYEDEEGDYEDRKNSNEDDEDDYDY